MDSFLNDNLWLLLVVLWMLPWKAVALWKAAQRNKKGWFIALLLLNTLGILEGIYIFWISERQSSNTHDAETTEG